MTTIPPTNSAAAGVAALTIVQFAQMAGQLKVRPSELATAYSGVAAIGASVPDGGDVAEGAVTTLPRFAGGDQAEALGRELQLTAAQLAAALEARRTMFADAVAALAAVGLRSRVVVDHRAEMSRSKVGDLVGVREVYDWWEMDNRLSHVVKLTERTEPGVRASICQQRCTSVYLIIDHGPHRVILVDGNDVLVAGIGDGPNDAGRRSSIRRLRTLAAKDGLHVRTRDRGVSLVDPFGNIVHRGDVVTAFAWLLNIDLASESAPGGARAKAAA